MTPTKVSKWSYSLNSYQQVAPQAAKTMSPQFAPMGGFGGGSSNSFGQMPTGAAPTATNNANYPPINAHASLNGNSYGRLCAYICEPFDSVMLVHHLTPLCFIPDGSRSGPHFPSRAAEAVWPQWQGQQHSQSNAEQHPHAQGNQQDIYPVSETSLISLMHLLLLSLSPKLNLSLWFRMCCLCWTSLPTSMAMTLRYPCTLRLTSDPVNTSQLLHPFCLLECLYPHSSLCYMALIAFLLHFSSCSWEKHSSLAMHGFNCTAESHLKKEGRIHLTADIMGRKIKDLLLTNITTVVELRSHRTRK